jgi:hypothetical protein
LGSNVLRAQPRPPMHKPELILAVAEDIDEYGPRLRQFAEAKIAAELLRDILSGAEKRLAIALANVEGEDGDGGRAA